MYLPVIDITKHLVWPQFKSFYAVKRGESKLRLKRISWHLNCCGLTVKLSGSFRSMAKSSGLVVSLVGQKSCTYSAFAECICKSDVMLEAQLLLFMNVESGSKHSHPKNAILKHIRKTAVVT